MRTIKIDQKTYLEIGDNKDPEETKQRFLDKLRISREKGMRTRIPYISD